MSDFHETFDVFSGLDEKWVWKLVPELLHVDLDNEYVDFNIRLKGEESKATKLVVLQQIFIWKALS